MIDDALHGGLAAGERAGAELTLEGTEKKRGEESGVAMAGAPLGN